MAMSDFKKIEKKWQKYWEENLAEMYGAIDKGPKKYILNEFPYPSGSGLHIGHTFSFTGGDVYARFRRMKGDNVLFPMGWDAFGLPTENYAIKMKRKPQEVTAENTAMFKKQMKRLAFSFDWSREVNTTDPAYYKWTQWIFIKLFEKGLAFKREMPINWCPSCKIGLANEEVVDGRCERCGDPNVVKRNISQWVVKITDYADKLIEGLEGTDFVEKVKTAQINWIGRSTGARVKFVIANGVKQSDVDRHASARDDVDYLEVFTTRPDTLYGATFMVVAPEHDLVSSVIANGVKQSENKGIASSQVPRNDVVKIKEYVEGARKKTDMERTELSKGKTGVFSGLYAINPVTKKEIPIWISDFVLASYGTGAIMAVPAHDQRDFDFAKKFGLPVVPVIDRVGANHDSPLPNTDVDNGVTINSPLWNGLKPKQAIVKAIEYIEKEGIGEKASSYHLRDWIFSRQHYWGEPIPMIYCTKCAVNQNEDLRFKIQEYAKEKGIDIKVLLNNPGWYPVPEEQLPVELPEVEAYEPTDTGESPLANMTNWVKTKCPVCGCEAKRETDTMPNWAGSDWYFLAYCLAGKLQEKTPPSPPLTRGESSFDSKNVLTDIFSSSNKELKYWMPVDVYIGGDEHNTLHLLYSRFIYKFLYDLGVVPKEILEPYYKRISHGVILGPDGARMSKSRGNVIVPEVVADRYGVDVVRCYLMFMGPYDATMVWNEKTLMGVKRFLDKFFQFIQKQILDNKQNNNLSDSSREVKVIVNKMIDGVERDIESFKYNTALAKMMEGLNNLRISQNQLSNEDIKTLIKLLAPFAPYTTEELWDMVDKKEKSVHQSSWPEVDKSCLVESQVILPVSINGKRRYEIKVNSDDLGNEEEVKQLASQDNGFKKWTEGKNIERYIYIEGRMLNIVVK